MVPQIYTDGGSYFVSDPKHPYGVGAAVLFLDGYPVEAVLRCSLKATNNQAEMDGMLMALAVLTPWGKAIKCFVCGVLEVGATAPCGLGMGCGALNEPTVRRCLWPAADVYTDSEYVLNGLTLYMPIWKANGWKTALKKQPVLNKDRWEALDKAYTGAPHDLFHVKGHSLDSGNALADMLCTAALTTMRAYATQGTPFLKDFTARIPADFFKHPVGKFSLQGELEGFIID